MKNICIYTAIIFLSLSSFMSCDKKKEESVKSNAPSHELKIETKIIQGFKAPNTPAKYNKVGYNRYYFDDNSGKERPILIIFSGYVAGTGWFDKMARYLVKKKNLEVWTIMRRHFFFEKREELKADIEKFINAKDQATRNRLLIKINRSKNYASGSADPIGEWGYDVYLEDIKRVVQVAKKYSKNIFLGGWSDGVEYAMAYAHFKSKKFGFGYKDLKGLVFFDENPEWGWVQKKQKYLKNIIKISKNLMAKKDTYFYMNYYPSLATHELALALAHKYPNKKSPLAKAFRLPENLREKGITNRVLIGWLYENTIAGFSRKQRGGFAYLIRSGEINLPNYFSDSTNNKDKQHDSKHNDPALKKSRKEKGLYTWKTHKKTKEVTNLNYLIQASVAPGYLWELFYPRKVILDYWLIAECDFKCPEFSLYHTKKNKLPIYYILTGTNNVGNTVPAAMTWYMKKNSITHKDVTYNKLYTYSHADMFTAVNAPQKLYDPLFVWIQTISGNIKKKVKK